MLNIAKQVVERSCFSLQNDVTNYLHISKESRKTKIYFKHAKVHSEIYFLSTITGKEEKSPTVPQFTISTFLGNSLPRDDRGDRRHHGENSLQNSGSHQHHLKSHKQVSEKEDI